MNLSQQLALAIGWKQEDFVDSYNTNKDCVLIKGQDGVKRTFSINEKGLMWKIAERFDAFPIKNLDGTWDVIGPLNKTSGGKTPEEAVASYVIKHGDEE